MIISYIFFYLIFVVEVLGVDFDNIIFEIVEEIKEGLVKVCDRFLVIY